MLGIARPDTAEGGLKPAPLRPTVMQKAANGRKVAFPLPMLQMFLLGSDNNELKRCLTKIRVRLIAAGVKADNLPPDHQGRVKMVASLPPPAMKHVRDWFRKNVEFEALPDPVQACAELSDEAGEFEGGGDRLHALWRSVLSAFVMSEHTEVVGQLLNAGSSSPPRSLAPEPSPGQFELTEADAKDALNAVAGTLGPLTQGKGARAVIGGIMASLAGDHTAHAAAVASLHAMKSPVADRFIEVLDALHHQQPAPAASPGAARGLVSLSEAGLDDFSSLTVLGKFKHRIESGRFFIHVAAIVNGVDVVSLSDDELKNIFKETGDATADRNTVHISTAEENSLMVWRVDDERPAEKSRYVVKERIGHTYAVIDVPHSSGEPDLVREWIKHVHRPILGEFAVFRLADGPIIKFSGDNVDTAKANFEEPLAGYRTHPVIRWHGRHIVVSPFGAADFRYDCAPPRTVVKRLFKTMADLSTVLPITKRQISDLADMASQYAGDETLRKAIARAQVHLESLFGTKDLLDELMSEIVALPLVQSSIAREIERQAAAARGEIETSRKSLDALLAEKKRIQYEIEALKAAQKKELSNLGREVRLAFENAGADGYKSLAAISLFKHALGLEGGTPGPHSAPATRIPAETNMPVPAIRQAKGKRLADRKDLDQAIELQCGRNGLSPRLLRTAIAAAASNGLIALTGENPGAVTDALFSILCGGISCTVSVTGDIFSLSDLMNANALAGPLGSPHAIGLGEFLALCQQDERACVVRLRGANRMPPEGMFHELLDFAGSGSGCHAIAWTARNGTPRSVQKKAPLIFVAELVEGKSVFPLAGSLAWQIPLIDTSIPWGDSDAADAELGAHYSFADSVFYAMLAGNAAAKNPHLIESLPGLARRSAAQMASAAIAAGLPDAESSLMSYLPFALGRVGHDNLEAVLKQSGGQLANDCRTYAAASDHSQYFDTGNH